MPHKNPTPAHEFADIFPLHDGARLTPLVEAIGRNGLRHPIVLLEGKVLDGRRRELACFKANKEPIYREFGSDIMDGVDPLEFVIDENLVHRHLSDQEKAMVAAKWATAKVGGDRQSKKASAQVEQMVPTNAQAAEKFGVSVPNLRRAKAVQAHGTPALQEAVKDGVLSMSAAAEAAAKPADVQEKVVADARSGAKRKGAKKPKKDGDGQQQNGQPQPEPGVGDGAGKASLQRKRALEASADVIDYLRRSPLKKIGVNNPHRDYAFDEVIRWLKVEKKGKKSNGSE